MTDRRTLSMMTDLLLEQIGPELPDERDAIKFGGAFAEAMARFIDDGDEEIVIGIDGRHEIWGDRVIN